MRILAPILTDLVLLYKTCRIWNSSPNGFAWALPSKIVRWEGFLWERVIFNVCMFWHMFLWRLSMSKAQVEVRTSVNGLNFWLSKRKTSKQEYMYWVARNSKGRQCNKEIREIIVRDPQINMRYFIIFLNFELQYAH